MSNNLKMINEFVQSQFAHQAFADFLVSKLKQELDRKSILRTATRIDNLSSGTFPYYDNVSNEKKRIEAFIIDHETMKTYSDTHSRLMVPIFSIESFRILPIETNWNDKLEKIFKLVLKDLLKKETDIMNEIIKQLDDISNYTIIMPVRQELMGIYMNDENKACSSNFNKTGKVNESLMAPAKKEGFCFLEHIGLAAVRK